MSLFTVERQYLIVKYKTSFYSFYVPIALGMVISGVRDDAAYKVAEDICTKMGVYFQIQDDILDCYGEPEKIGKVGTDIEDNKCTWLVVKALSLASPAQRKVLEEHYGKKSEESVHAVKALYRELKLKELFDEYEEETYKSLTAQIDTVTAIPPECFTSLLMKIYKRDK